MSKINLCFSVVACVAVVTVNHLFAADAEMPELVFGAVSDIHLKTGYSTKKFDAVLKFFADEEVDAVLLAGDITDYGLVPELKLAGDCWRRAFPGNLTPKGKHCEKLFHYGDHDCCGTIHKRMPESHVKPYGTRDDVEQLVINRYGKAKAWHDAFDEDWAPFMCKTVNGYDFILSSYSEGEDDNPIGNHTHGMKEYFASQKFDSSKPFFYSQHRASRGTIPFGSTVDDGYSTAVLSQYPNCVAFCGHLHEPVAREFNIWQGAYSAVQIPSASYECFRQNEENYWCKHEPTPVQMPMLTDTTSVPCLLVKVYKNRIVISRHEVFKGGKCGPDWVIPLGNNAAKPYSPETRIWMPPVFSAKWTKVDEYFGKDRDHTHGKPNTDQVIVSFPVASSNGKHVRAINYVVTPESLVDGVWQPWPQVKHVLSPGIMFSEAEDKGPVRCVFARDELPKGNIRFRIEPAADHRTDSPFMKLGEPLYTKEFLYPGGHVYNGGIVANAVYSLGATLTDGSDSNFRITSKPHGEAAVVMTEKGYCKTYAFDLCDQAGKVYALATVEHDVKGLKTELRVTVEMIEKGVWYYPKYGSDNFAMPITFRFDAIENWTVHEKDLGGRPHYNLLVPHAKFDKEKWDLNRGDLAEVEFSGPEKSVRLSAGKDSVLTLNRYPPTGFEMSLRHRVPEARAGQLIADKLVISMVIEETAYLCSDGSGR